MGMKGGHRDACEDRLDSHRLVNISCVLSPLESRNKALDGAYVVYSKRRQVKEK